MKALIQFWIAFGMRTSTAYSSQPSPTDEESPGGKFPDSRYRTTANMQDVREALRAAFRAGADGVILWRKYSEMRLANLRAAGDGLSDGL